MQFPLRDPQFRADIEAARLAGWLAKRAAHPRCCALRSNGEVCKGLALPGKERCYVHDRAAASGRKRRPNKCAPSPARKHSRVMRSAWSTSAWCLGWTVELPRDAEADLVARLRDEGFHMDWISPKVLDWLRWKVVTLHRQGRFEADWNRLVDELRRRDAATGDAPEGVDLPDYSEASHLHCWHPRLTLKPGNVFTPIRQGRGRTATAAQLAARDAAIRDEQSMKAQAWRPRIGGPLTPAERLQLDRAAERDERRGGTAHMALARATIENWRRYTIEHPRLEPEHPPGEAALAAQREVAERVRRERKRFVLDEDGQVAHPARHRAGRSSRSEGW